MSRGKFIIFEGIDGSGKGKQLELAHSYLWNLSKEIDILTTREPTRDFAEIRKKMASGKAVSDDRIWYVQQFTADRVNHCANYISPNLERGTHVLCDRYYHSTLVYQGVQGISFEEVLAMQRKHPEVLIPDLTLIYDCPVEVAFERIRKRGGEKDVFEDREFQERLRENYLTLTSKLAGERIVIVNANQSIDAVFEETKKEIASLLSK